MITASIVLYKTSIDELKSILNCIMSSPIVEIYIIDNSPTDNLKNIALSFSKVKYIFGHGNIGYGRAHNIAINTIRNISGINYHIILNSDILFEPEDIMNLKLFMDENPDIGQLMPKIVYPDNKIQYLCKLLPTPLDLINRRFLSSIFDLRKRNSRYEMRFSNYNENFEAPSLSGCFMFCRKNVLVDINGFDDRFFMYCEDIDLCRRISEKGFKTIFYSDVKVVHMHKKESFKSKKMLLCHISSAIKYFNKWGWIYDPYRRRINNKCISQFRKEIYPES